MHAAPHAANLANLLTCWEQSNLMPLSTRPFCWAPCPLQEGGKASPCAHFTPKLWRSHFSLTALPFMLLNNMMAPFYHRVISLNNPITHLMNGPVHCEVYWLHIPSDQHVADQPLLSLATLLWPQIMTLRLSSYVLPKCGKEILKIEYSRSFLFQKSAECS
jgi:hypothetical protein